MEERFFMKLVLLYLAALMSGSEGKIELKDEHKSIAQQLKSGDRPYMNTYMSEESLLLQRCNELSISAPPAEWPGNPFSALLDPSPVRTTNNDRCNKMEDILQSYNGTKLPCWQRNYRDVISMNGRYLREMTALLMEDLDETAQWMELERFMVAALDIESSSKSQKMKRCNAVNKKANKNANKNDKHV